MDSLVYFKAITIRIGASGSRLQIMKKKLILFGKTILFLVILLAVMAAVMVVTQRKESYEKNAAFFDEAKKDHVDVLFLGSSHVINGINPAVLYRDYGFTSYNLGGHGSLMQETYWQLIRALDVCKPKCVVVDTYMLEKDYQYVDIMDDNATDADRSVSVEQLHLNMDAYPLSKLKIAAINELVFDKEIKKEFLFDFMVYHDRWKELGGEDFKAITGKSKKNKLMGAEMRYGVKTDVDVYDKAADDQILTEETVGMTYLRKILDECKRDGIEVIPVYLPFSATTTDQIAANTAGAIASEFDTTYLNMLKADGIIDEAADLNDHGHLNSTGAEKVTDYIGNVLMEKDILIDHRGDEEYSEWDKVVQGYEKEIEGLQTDGTDLISQINLLSLNNVSNVIFFNEGSAALKDEGLMNLIKNISGTDKVFEAAAAGGPYLLICDNGNGKIYEASGYETLEGVPTTMGDMMYIPIEKKFRLLYPTSDESLNYLYDDNHLEEDIQIVTYDNESGELLSHLYYTSGHPEYVVNK